MSWEDRRLGDLVRLRSGGTPSKSESRYWEGDIPWLSAKDLTTGRIYDAPLKVTEAGAANGTRLMPENTVMFVVRGMSLASEFRVSITKRPCTFNQDLKAVECGGDIIPEFLFYSLFAQRERIKGQAGEASHGTKKLETHTVENIRLKVPSRAVQERVVEVAASYDDLIENNRRRIALLEEAARLLYREWFVHLRFPGHEHVPLADGLPNGWERQIFEDVCETIGGGTPKTEKPEFWNDGDIPWYTPTDITRNSCLALLDSATKITEAGLRGSSAKMLPAETVLMTSRASVGFFGIIETPSCTNQGFISIIPHDPRARMYLLHNLMHRVEEIRSHAGGATYKEISKGKFRALPVVIPDAALLREFEHQASTLHAQVRTLHTQNQKLAQARDILLPRLMNGEIAV